MDRMQVRSLKRKEDRTDEEDTLVRYYGILSSIEDSLIEASKIHIDSEEALRRIRQELIENWH